MNHKLLANIFTEYAAYLQAEKGLGASSQRSYLNAAKGFLSVCQARTQALFLPDDWGWEHLDKRAVEVYLNHLRAEKGWKPASLAQQTSALRSFFFYLQKQGHIRRNPVRSLKPKVPARQPDLPEGGEEAVMRLFRRQPATLAEARLLLLLELFYGAGLRQSQVYRIRFITVRKRARSVRLHMQDQTLDLPCSEPGLMRVADYLTRRKAVVAENKNAPFWVDSLGRPCSAARLSRQVRRALSDQGLEGGPVLLRQLAAQHFRQRGGDTRSLRALLGAKRLGDLDRYTPPEFRRVLRQFRRVHPRQEDRG